MSWSDTKHGDIHARWDEHSCACMQFKAACSIRHFDQCVVVFFLSAYEDLLVVLVSRSTICCCDGDSHYRHHASISWHAHTQECMRVCVCVPLVSVCVCLSTYAYVHMHMHIHIHEHTAGWMLALVLPARGIVVLFFSGKAARICINTGRRHVIHVWLA
jgi:hypothetical protein